MSIYNKKPSAVAKKLQAAQKRKATSSLQSSALLNNKKPLIQTAHVKSGHTKTAILPSSPTSPINTQPAQFVSLEEWKAVFGEADSRYQDNFQCAEKTLHFALRQKKFGLFQDIFERGQNFNASHIIEATQQSLCQAAYGWKSFDILLYLLRQNPDVNYQNEKQTFLLVGALESQDLSFIEMLFSKKANANLLTQEGLSPLHYLKRNFFVNKDVEIKITQLMFDNGFKEELLVIRGQSVFKNMVKQGLYSAAHYLFTRTQNLSLLLQFSQDMKEIIEVYSHNSKPHIQHVELQTLLEEKIKALSEKAQLNQSLEEFPSLNNKMTYKI